MAKTKWVPTDRYVEAADRAELLLSTRNLLDAMVRAPGVKDSHRRYWLKHVTWDLTQTEGKYNVPYATKGALTCTETKGVTHEHVFQRAWIVDEILKDPTRLDIVIAAAMACMVTKAEDKLLAPYRHLIGWDRYRAAGLRIHDMRSLEPVEIDVLIDRFPVP